MVILLLILITIEYINVFRRLCEKFNTKTSSVTQQNALIPAFN